ncbi:MAG: hypothetical protein JO122_03070, partial [Acetobacteraceae bacterium]|nr:hypothetical protein [Acetobacteraceae bacterium]
MAEDRRADRARDEAHRIDGESLQHTDQRIRVGEEKLAENKAGYNAVKQEIVPFDGGPTVLAITA